jgi:hypothetical protein
VLLWCNARELAPARRALTDDPIPDSRENARTSRALASRLSRRATKIGGHLPHEASTPPEPPRGLPFRVLVRTVRHLQSIAFCGAKALTLIGISARLPADRNRPGLWAAPLLRGALIATAALEARIRPLLHNAN